MPQILPNPNKNGNTINVDTKDWYNWGDSKDHFLNNGLINISSKGSLKNQADLTNWATLTNKGVIHNSGLFDNSYYWPGSSAVFKNYHLFYIANGGKLQNTGHFVNESGAELHVNDFLIDNEQIQNDGTLENMGLIANAAFIYSSGTLVNYKSGVIQNDAEIAIDGTFNNYGVITNNGNIDNWSGTFVNEKDALIQGSGRIIGSITNHGTINAGNSSGGHLILGDFYHATDGVVEIELGGHSDFDRDLVHTQYDFVDVAGDLVIDGGSLEVSLVDDFKIMRGQQFIIAKIDGDQHGQYQGLSEGSSVGQFEGFNGNMLDLFITYQAGDGNDIALQAPPLTNPDLIFSSPLLI